MLPSCELPCKEHRHASLRANAAADLDDAGIGTRARNECNSLSAILYCTILYYTML